MAINIDIMSVSDEDEALTLMLHHLRLAASYFEATPDPIPTSAWQDDFSAPAISKWVQEMDSLYPEI